MTGSRMGGGGHGDFRLVLEKLASPGAHVRKGDAVAEFDRLAMATRLDDYTASRVEHDTNVKVLLENLKVKRAAREQLLRVARARVDKAALDLKTAPVRSAIKVELFRIALDEARASYDALRNQAPYNEAADAADVRRSQLHLQEAVIEQRRAQVNLDRMVAHAPINGLVVILETFRGTEFAGIGAGDEVRPGQPYAQIVDTRPTFVEAKANQADVMDLRVGAPARVRFDAYPGLMLPGRLHSISPLGKSGGWRRSYVSEIPVVIKLDAADPRVIPGLTVSAEVVLQAESGGSVVPRETVSLADNDRPIAYVKSGSGWEKRDLELGLANHVAVNVRSGLREGEEIAAGIPADLK